MDKIRVISVYPNFANHGGAQDMALRLAEKLNEGTVPIVLTETCVKDIVLDYRERAKFISFSWKSVHNLVDEHTVFFSHHRKSTSLLMFFSLILGKKLHVIHIAHNTFTNLRFLCFFPKRVVAVSNGVKENLVNYFRLPEHRITVIFNGIEDANNVRSIRKNDGKINVLLPGRICSVKQQVELVKQTIGKLHPHIHIYFAGEGEDLEQLKEEIGSSTQYHYAGFINMVEQLNQYDYVCLFSLNEGLPLSLIEGLRFGKPLITNKLSAVLDVNKPGETGFAYDDFSSLIDGLNHLPHVDWAIYKQMASNTRKRFEECFTEEKMINRYKLMLYNEIKYSPVTM